MEASEEDRVRKRESFLIKGAGGIRGGASFDRGDMMSLWQASEVILAVDHLDGNPLCPFCGCSISGTDEIRVAKTQKKKGKHISTKCHNYCFEHAFSKQ